jgi:ABC-type multidrug transport system, ATPase and permease components
MQKQKRRNGFTIMAKLIVLVGSLAYIMLLAVVNGLLGYLAALGTTLFGAMGVAQIIDSSTFGSQVSVWLFVGLAVGSGVLRGILRYFEQYSNHNIAFKLLALLRDKIFNKLRKLAPAKIDNKNKGNLVAMITSDVEILEVFYAHTVSPVFIAITVSLTIFLFVGLFINWYLAAVAICAYVVIGIVFPPIASKAMASSGVNYKKKFASFSSYFLDSIRGAKEIVVHNAVEDRKKNVDEQSEGLLSSLKIMKRATARITGSTELLVTIFLIITTIVGIVLAKNGTITAGKMIIGIVAIFGSFGPVIAIAALPSSLTLTFAAGDRLLNLLAEKPIVEDVTNKQNIEYKDVKVENVTFGYEENVEVLKDISMHAGKGEIVGIVGASGCGKSTLLKLLLRFYPFNKGDISYNDISINDINTQSLLSNVTMISQTTYLFDESIKENLRIAKADATEEEMKEACKVASIDDFISDLPQGYDTQVASAGNNLSAGEKQRVGLARAFLRGSELILLDEPTSNLDSINEGIILKSLLSMKGKRSIILVSHRKSTMAIADRIYKIENGNISEVKDRKEILNEG